MYYSKESKSGISEMITLIGIYGVYLAKNKDCVVIIIREAQWNLFPNKNHFLFNDIYSQQQGKPWAYQPNEDLKRLKGMPVHVIDVVLMCPFEPTAALSLASFLTTIATFAVVHDGSLERWRRRETGKRKGVPIIIVLRGADRPVWTTTEDGAAHGRDGIWQIVCSGL